MCASLSGGGGGKKGVTVQFENLTKAVAPMRMQTHPESFSAELVPTGWLPCHLRRQLTWHLSEAVLICLVIVWNSMLLFP